MLKRFARALRSPFVPLGFVAVYAWAAVSLLPSPSSSAAVPPEQPLALAATAPPVLAAAQIEPTAAEQPTLTQAEPTAASSPTPAPSPAPSPTPSTLRTHLVREGETTALIAERYGLKLETILAANELSNPDLLKVGQELLVPAADGVLYRVAEGDTLRKIADRFGVDMATILAANSLGPDPAVLAVGTRVLVPGARPALNAAAPLQATALEKLAPVSAPAPRRVSDEPPPAVTARYIAIVDAASGQVLHEQGAHEQVAPASVTKIATTIVALERGGDLNRIIPVTISGSAMAARDGSSIMGLEPGERVTLKTLLYGMMLPSGNDAAEQVALALAGSRERYVGWMNELVRTLGLRNTQFANPSGMDARGHYSSAHDMAMLSRYGMSGEVFRQLSAAATYRGDGYSLSNLNRLIGTYSGADGIKIGRTPAAGRTIVASATRDGRRVLVSLMRSQDLPGDSASLFDWVWRTFDWET